MWVKVFEALIEGAGRAINPAERLYFLRKYVEAKEVMNGFMLLYGDDAYLKAKEMQAKRFGHHSPAP